LRTTTCEEKAVKAAGLVEAVGDGVPLDLVGKRFTIPLAGHAAQNRFEDRYVDAHVCPGKCDRSEAVRRQTDEVVGRVEAGLLVGLLSARKVFPLLAK
jgi:hypothetical protein